MAFTEFCCRSGGSNLNAGTKTGNSTEPGTGATYSSTNGNWDGTSIFIPTDGSTPASTIAAGDFASVYLDAATVAVYIGRITTVVPGVNGAITVSTTAKSGTAPAVGATGRTLTVGGAWKGPNAAEKFPIGFITNALTNAAADIPRVNFKNDATYSITASMVQTNTGPIQFQGYTTAFGDLGKAIFDGGATGASYILLDFAGGSPTNLVVTDCIFQNNGNSAGGTSAVNLLTNCAIRCVAHDVYQIGFINGTLEQCEAYNCNQSNTAARAGIYASAAASWTRCISHDNSGSNTSGFYIAGANLIIKMNNCIADTNGLDGLTSIGAVEAINCDFYNSTAGAGIRVSQAAASIIRIDSCNFIKNAVYGINLTGGARIGDINNCGFGAGTQANGTGQTNALSGVVVTGTVTYAADVTPWVAPTTGNFSVTLAAAIAAGIGNFTETQASYTGTIGYPVIGAAQASAAATGGGPRGIIGA